MFNYEDNVIILMEKLEMKEYRQLVAYGLIIENGNFTY